jgi:cytochrome c553
MANHFASNNAKWVRQTATLKTVAVSALACLSFLTFNAQAGLEEGRVKAQVCVACHGVDGNSAIPTIPSLAGQPRQFIVTALYMFREGTRKNDMMTAFTEKLTNADLNDLAPKKLTQR